MAKFRYRRKHTLLIIAAVTILLLYKVLRQEEMDEPPIVLEINYVEKRLIGKVSVEPILHHSEPSARMMEFYKAQVPQRRAYLEATYKNQPLAYTYIYNNLAPEVFCPELVRVGTTHDGGKWICSPFRIPDGCTIISLGLYNEITFERELQHIIDKRCNIFAYDSNDQEVSTIVLLNSILTKASKATIAAESNPSKNEYTLAELLHKEKVKDIEILKCDIEGSELTVLPDFLEQHKPAQILIEIHGTPAQVVALLSLISRHGYWLFSHEINGAWHNLCEFSFIHEKAFLQYGATPMAKYLDVPTKPHDTKSEVLKRSFWPSPNQLGWWSINIGTSNRSKEKVLIFLQPESEANHSNLVEVFREIRTRYVEQRLAQKPYFAPVAPHSKPSPRMIELYRIQVYCPELVRVGSTNDGGKWICSPFRIPKNCTIFSLGLFNEITFEQELQYIINKRCKIYAYDSSDQETKTMILLSEIRTKFKKATIAAETNLYKNEYSLDDLLSEADAEDIEIFKCDIEGSEFTVLPEFLKQHKPAQVLVEVHGTPAQMITFLSIVSRQGYYLFAHQINGAYHNMCEFSFIHEKALLRYGATPLGKYLDIPTKVPGG